MWYWLRGQVYKEEKLVCRELSYALSPQLEFSNRQCLRDDRRVGFRTWQCSKRHGCRAEAGSTMYCREMRVYRVHISLGRDPNHHSVFQSKQLSCGDVGGHAQASCLCGVFKQSDLRYWDQYWS